MQLNPKLETPNPELKPGPCSIHVTNLGPREAKLLGAIVALFTDPQHTKLGCAVIDGQALLACDQVNGGVLVIEQVAFVPHAAQLN